MNKDKLYASPLSRPPTSKATGIERMMVNRKTELKMILNSHHIGAAERRPNRAVSDDERLHRRSTPLFRSA